jgi:hypothetical protein
MLSLKIEGKVTCAFNKPVVAIRINKQVAIGVRSFFISVNISGFINCEFNFFLSILK